MKISYFGISLPNLCPIGKDDIMTLLFQLSGKQTMNDLITYLLVDMYRAAKKAAKNK